MAQKPVIKEKRMTKKRLAETMGIPRSTFYYQSKIDAKDIVVEEKIKRVLDTDGKRSYGHKRLALDLGINKKKILRIMKKYDLKPTIRRRTKKPVKRDDIGAPVARYENLIKDFCPIVPNVVWASDFTYIKHKGKFIYLATVLDIVVRDVLGFSISNRHDKFLVKSAMEDALAKHDPPRYNHMDQGSEYRSSLYTEFVSSFKVEISMSAKGSPWQNGYQESFFSGFKLALGDPDRFKTIGELIGEIYRLIHLYNEVTMHSVLKKTPSSCRKEFEEKSNLNARNVCVQ
jgi:putative transposase